MKFHKENKTLNGNQVVSDFQNGKDKEPAENAQQKQNSMNLYQPHPATLQRPIQLVKEYLSKHEITVTGGDYKPILQFEEANFPPQIAKLILNEGYETPTPIQSQSWPIALSGKDLVGIAKTGSGKTLGYILPALIHINNKEEPDYRFSPFGVVLAPTRELVQQIYKVARTFGMPSGIRSVCVYGGADRRRQVYELQRGVELIIATPGRLIDLLNTDAINLDHCSYLVFDEADRMLDMGFEPQIREILKHISSDRQTLMWSATWPKEVRRLAEDFLDDYVKVIIGSQELNANPNITQIVDVCEEREKKSKLLDLLQDIYCKEENKTLVFACTKNTVEYLEHFLKEFGYRAACMHGDKSQGERNYVLANFRSGKNPFLIATDVAARGLDILGIKFVINYDYPLTSEDYIHRIGRTGRSNSTGTAYTFFTKKNANQAYGLISVLKGAKQTINPSLNEMARFKFSGAQRRPLYRKFANRKPTNKKPYGGRINFFEKPVADPSRLVKKKSCVLISNTGK